MRVSLNTARRYGSQFHSETYIHFGLQYHSHVGLRKSTRASRHIKYLGITLAVECPASDGPYLERLRQMVALSAH